MVSLPSRVLITTLVILMVNSNFFAQAFHRNQVNDYYYLGYMDTTVCRTIPGLVKEQIELCLRQPDAVTAAMQGIENAVEECQRQFNDHRWNCSSLDTKGGNPYVNAIFNRGYPETAFAHAITAAGVAISVARACSAGQMANCGCDSRSYKLREDKAAKEASTWKWGGCSHNLRHGLRFSRHFLDTTENGKDDMRSSVNLHNNKVGRHLVSSNMQVRCKCHGMSGSCELKTCWRATPDIKMVGQILKERYQAAVDVDQVKSGKKNLRKFNSINHKKNHVKPKPRIWSDKRNKRKRGSSRDLQYYQRSPSFCDADKSLDVFGTTGRSCNKSSKGPDSCVDLCCGRGYDLVKRRRVERCHCRFVWCCQVECQTCTYEEWVSVCK